MYKIILKDPEEINNALHFIADLGIQPATQDWNKGIIGFRYKQSMEAAAGRLMRKGIYHVTEEED